MGRRDVGFRISDFGYLGSCGLEYVMNVMNVMNIERRQIAKPLRTEAVFSDCFFKCNELRLFNGLVLSGFTIFTWSAKNLRHMGM